MFLRGPTRDGFQRGGVDHSDRRLSPETDIKPRALFIEDAGVWERIGCRGLFEPRLGPFGDRSLILVTGGGRRILSFNPRGVGPQGNIGDGLSGFYYRDRMAPDIGDVNA